MIGFCPCRFSCLTRNVGCAVHTGMGSQECLKQHVDSSCGQEYNSSFPEDIICLLTQLSPEEGNNAECTAKNCGGNCGVPGCTLAAPGENKATKYSCEDDVILSQWELEKWMERRQAVDLCSNNITIQSSGGNLSDTGDPTFLTSMDPQHGDFDKDFKLQDKLGGTFKLNKTSVGNISNNSLIRDDAIDTRKLSFDGGVVPTTTTCSTETEKGLMSNINAATEGGDGCSPGQGTHTIILSDADYPQADVVSATHLVHPRMDNAAAAGSVGTARSPPEELNKRHSTHLERSLPAHLNDVDTMHCSVCGMELSGESDEIYARHFEQCSSRLEGSFAGNLMQAPDVTLSLKQFLQVGLLPH